MVHLKIIGNMHYLINENSLKILSYKINGALRMAMAMELGGLTALV
jgi:hypothetical protein